MGGVERGSGWDDRWLDPAHVFADTGRVDLFNDPRWDPPPERPERRVRPTRADPGGDRPHRPGLLASVLASLTGRSASRRGRHVRRSSTSRPLATSSPVLSGTGRPERE